MTPESPDDLDPSQEAQPVVPPAPEQVGERHDSSSMAAVNEFDATVNLAGDSSLLQQLQERLSKPSQASEVTRGHLKGLLEALIFASDHPQKAVDLAKAASAHVKEVRELLDELKAEYQPRGIQLDEVAGGWVFRTSSVYAPFVRDLTKQKPVRLSRAQVETLAILAYRQPVTRPEIDEIRGVDSGPVLKLLLERDLVRILGKKDEPGRPMIYGTTTAFLEFFGLKSLKDLPTLREFTELTEDSRRVAERELGDALDHAQSAVVSDLEPSASLESDPLARTVAGEPHDGPVRDDGEPPSGTEPSTSSDEPA